jgi:hypothetical protein
MDPEPPLPPTPLRERIAGTENAEASAFDNSGARSLQNLQHALASIGRSFGEFNKVFEWGCGWGRLLGRLPAAGDPHAKAFGKARDDRCARLPSAAFLHLERGTALRWLGIGRIGFPRLAASLRELPCYRLETGDRCRADTRVIGSVLDALPDRNTLTA